MPGSRGGGGERGGERRERNGWGEKGGGGEGADYIPASAADWGSQKMRDLAVPREAEARCRHHRLPGCTRCVFPRELMRLKAPGTAAAPVASLVSTLFK